jgi:hypothetical protein
MLLSKYPLILSVVFAAQIAIPQKTLAQASPPGIGFNNQESGFPSCDSECAKRILKYSTIAIETPGASGSGVIVGHKDGIYTAITAAHVVRGFDSKESLFAAPHSRKSYRIVSVEYPGKSKFDIALVRFKAGEPLFVQPINFFISAPAVIQRTSWGIDGDGARSAGISLPSGAVTVPIFRFNEFATQERAEGNKDGYEFIYNATTVPGMSGGPIVGWRSACMSKSGRYIGGGYFSLVAIHGRSEGYSQGGRSGLSLGVPLDLIRDYLQSRASTYGIPSNDEEVNSIALAQYCPSVPSGYLQ